MINISDEQMQMSFLHGIIDRFEGEIAVVRLEDGQELRISHAKLPKEIKEGDGVRIRIMSVEEYGREKENIGKKIISEIIQTDA